MNIISVGDILWDVIGGSEFLGGAPFNLCAHLARLGHHASFVSAVGCDERGDRVFPQAASLGVDTRYLKRTDRAPTGISEVTLDAQGKAVHRLPRPAAYDFVWLTPEERTAIQQNGPQWISFCTLAQVEPDPRRVIHQLIADNAEANCFYDINLRPPFYTPELVREMLEAADAVKLNDEEAVVLAGLFSSPYFSFEQLCRALADRFALKLVCVTRGAEGCALWRQGEYVEQPGYKITVADTVGAGDAFSAALLHGLDQGWTLEAIAQFANRVGALVASRAGATPVWTEQEARNPGAGVTQEKRGSEKR